MFHCFVHKFKTLESISFQARLALYYGYDISDSNTSLLLIFQQIIYYIITTHFYNDKYIQILISGRNRYMSNILVIGKRIVIIQCFKVLSRELTLVLSDTRELNRVPNTK